METTGHVFLGANRSGAVDLAETDIDSVEVRLVVAGADSKSGTVDDVVVQTAMTSSSYVSPASQTGASDRAGRWHLAFRQLRHH